MAEVILIVRNGSPMAKYYGLYASGHVDTELFEEQLMLNMARYSPLDVKVIQRFPCDNSEAVLEKLRAQYEDYRPINGIWFRIDLASLRTQLNIIIKDQKK